jgi:hypothetical protein
MNERIEAAVTAYMAARDEPCGRRAAMGDALAASDAVMFRDAALRKADRALAGARGIDWDHLPLARQFDLQREVFAVVSALKGAGNE